MIFSKVCVTDFEKEKHLIKYKAFNVVIFHYRPSLSSLGNEILSQSTKTITNDYDYEYYHGFLIPISSADANHSYCNILIPPIIILCTFKNKWCLTDG
jgi:hypothetical protein